MYTGAEGATAPETLRQKDRKGEALLESGRDRQIMQPDVSHRRSKSPAGVIGAVMNLSGIHDRRGRVTSHGVARTH